MCSALVRKHGMEQEARGWRCEELIPGGKAGERISNTDVELTGHSKAWLFSQKPASLRVKPQE